MNCLQNLNFRHLPSDHCPVIPAHLLWGLYSSNSSTSSRSPIHWPHHPINLTPYSSPLLMSSFPLLSSLDSLVHCCDHSLENTFNIISHFFSHCVFLENLPQISPNQLSFLYLCLSSKIDWVKVPQLSWLTLLYHKPQLGTQHFLKTLLHVPNMFTFSLSCLRESGFQL